MFQKIFQLYVYGCFHISLCTVALVFHTLKIVDYNISWPYIFLIFTGTMTIYNAHRLVSSDKINSTFYSERFKVIMRFKKFLNVIFGISLIASLMLFFFVERPVQLMLVIPSVISILYVLPIFTKQKRLRDFPLIKIFLISWVYAILCRLIVFSDGLLFSMEFKEILSTVELFLFIFAITIPFDIRDAEIDKQSELKSIPLSIGFYRSKLLAVGAIIFALLIALYLFLGGFYSLSALLSLLFTFIISLSLIWKSEITRSDSYFSFWLDGTMAMPLLFHQLIVLI